MPPASRDCIETRLFRKGVSDQELRLAMDLVQEFVAAAADAGSADWWQAFASFYDDLTRAFTPRQIAAFEVGTDTVLVHAGLQTWTAVRERNPGWVWHGPAVLRRQASPMLCLQE